MEVTGDQSQVGIAMAAIQASTEILSLTYLTFLSSPQKKILPLCLPLPTSP